MLLCLLLSFSIWLIRDLSQNFEDVVNVPVMPRSNIEGRSEYAMEEVTVAARCSAKGYKMFEISGRRKPVTVEFKPEDLRYEGDDVYSIAAGDVLKYASAIVGDEVDMKGIVGQDVRMRFKMENHRKVPVRPVASLGFRPQYMAAGPLRTEPDSVVIYGDPSRLDRLESVCTALITLNDLRRNAHGSVKLEKQPGIRISSERVDYSLEVTRFVEIRKEKVPVVARNVPAGVDFSVYPSAADVTFKCAFPLGANPADRVSLYVDYNEFLGSISGRCMVRVSGVPGNVIEMAVSPEVCDCLERTTE